MVKFFGTYKRVLDEKGRLLIPAKLFHEGIKRYFVLRGFEGCLSVYEEEDFDALMEKLGSLDYFDPDARKTIRLASASVVELPVDIHGRVLIGKDILRDYAIGHDVTLIGVLDHFEIWDSTAYARYDLESGLSYGQKGSKAV
ncbi:MAG: cell division/cell wall cluster transcriptional repressor MraZ [Bacilli bacterium]|nr:cell division/cell wall cluster transcriptional repressor MraZ [Bacilli bacterium]